MKIKTFKATNEDSIDQAVNEWLAQNDVTMVYPPSANFVNVDNRYHVFSVTFYYDEKEVSDMAKAFRKAAKDHK